LATLKDIAQRAGTSIATVSYALNGRSEVSEKTRRLIVKAAQELKYKPHGIARSLKRNTTLSIGLLLSDLSGPFYSELIRAAEAVVFANGYNLIACSSYGGRNSTAIRFLEERHTDGILLLASDIDDDAILRNTAPSYPIILLDRTLSAPSVSSVTVDNEGGAYRMTQHLVDLGYREIGYIGGPSDSLDAKYRLSGYRAALGANRIKPQRRWLLQGGFTQEGGFSAVKALIARETVPGVIFCANDEMAVGAIKALQEEGIRVPEEVGVVGFDDINVAQYIRPTLTTMRQPLHQMGTLAARMAFDALNGATAGKNVKLETELVERESVIPRKAQDSPGGGRPRGKVGS
jgi:LacI family transcriptional regulator